MERLYYICSENNGADLLCGYHAICAFVHAYAKSRFSHDAAIYSDLKFHHFPVRFDVKEMLHSTDVCVSDFEKWLHKTHYYENFIIRLQYA